MGENKTANTNQTADESYKGFAPRWAAFSAAITHAALVLPLTWLVNGFAQLGIDRVLQKVPFKKDTWARFKGTDWTIAGPIIAIMTGYYSYKEGKEAYIEAKDAEHQFNKLSLERSLYREQLVEAGIKPKDTKFVREVDMRNLKFVEKPSSSHTDKIAAEKAATVDATPEL